MGRKYNAMAMKFAAVLACAAIATALPTTLQPSQNSTLLGSCQVGGSDLCSCSQLLAKHIIKSFNDCTQEAAVAACKDGACSNALFTNASWVNCHSIAPSRATDTWCNGNCNHDPPFCPSDLCQCTPGPAPPPPKGTLCFHNDGGNKCYEACSDGTKFVTKGIATPGKCDPKFNVVDSTEATYQCPDGVTNIKYCQTTILEVTVTTKGQA